MFLISQELVLPQPQTKSYGIPSLAKRKDESCKFKYRFGKTSSLDPLATASLVQRGGAFHLPEVYNAVVELPRSFGIP